jgi:precorrin-2 dehydrogenase/sirohydrochlorin ferrochelatase
MRRLFLEARGLRIPINVADAPEFCSFIVPSVVRRGRLQVAISTAGASPAVAGVLRQRMEQWLGPELEPMLELMAAARAWLKSHEADSGARARKLGALAAAGVEHAIQRGDTAAVDLLVRRCLGESVRLADLGIVLAGPHQSAEPNV